MFSVRTYRIEDTEPWDSFTKESVQGTFLHQRQFLSYHGDRFKDLSLMIEDGDHLLGLFPAAQNPKDRYIVVSHPGITYGGILHCGDLRGEMYINVFKEILAHYAGLGYKRLLYKAVPMMYHQAPAGDDLYALFRLGGKRVRCDLSSTIDLSHRLHVSKRRVRGLKKCQKAGIVIMDGLEFLEDLWPIIELNLHLRYSVSPVHSLADITMLAHRFAHNIKCVCAALDRRIVAGVILFLTPNTHHAQYIASTTEGRSLSALDMVFEHCISRAIRQDARFFDFGISTEDDGSKLNSGLCDFKSDFGAGTTVHEFYELELCK
jgi:hypothetical protein